MAAVVWCIASGGAADERPHSFCRMDARLVDRGGVPLDVTSIAAHGLIPGHGHRLHR